MNNNAHDDEIDLSVIGQKISNFFNHVGKVVFNGIVFLKKNIIIILTLFVIGIVGGYFIDKNNNSYFSDIIVAPNFGSVDDLYTKVDLLQSRLTENDTAFWKQIGINDVKKINRIKIEPIVDVYGLINTNTASANNAQNTQNFELVKLLAEDSDINKVIKEDLTKKRYANFIIKITSNGRVNDVKHIKPLLKYLNNSEYYSKIQKEFVVNIHIKMKQNQIIIDQINTLLNQFGQTTNNQKNDKLVYYNENNQLNDIINNKNNLTAENGSLRIQLVNLDSVIKATSIVLNQKDTKGINSKMMVILPILLLLLFLVFSFGKLIFSTFNKKYA
jgi:hypothetical protein